MEVEPDIEKMTLNEYFEYKSKKERRLRRNVRSKRNPTKYEGADFNFFHQDKSRAFDYPYYHEDIKIKKYNELPHLLPCFQPAQPYTKAGLVSCNESDEVDIDSMIIAECELYIAKHELRFEEVFDDLFKMGTENLRGMKLEEAKMKDCDEGNMDDIWDIIVDDVERTHGEDAVEHIKYFLKIVDPIDLPNVNQDKLRVDYWKLGSDEIKPTNEETSDLEETNHDDEQEIDEIFRIKTNLFDYETPLCKKFKEFNYLLKIDPDLLTKDIKGFKTYEEYKDDLIYEWNENVPWLLVCNIRRFEMIKYSFGDDDEHVAVKEDEYDELTNTSKEAIHAYREIFRMVDEGWKVTRAK
ncbi:hypothetical protein Tco_1547523 [Tanacetum coccineum]